MGLRLAKLAHLYFARASFDAVASWLVVRACVGVDFAEIGVHFGARHFIKD